MLGIPIPLHPNLPSCFYHINMIIRLFALSVDTPHTTSRSSDEVTPPFVNCNWLYRILPLKESSRMAAGCAYTYCFLGSRFFLQRPRQDPRPIGPLPAGNLH